MGRVERRQGRGRAATMRRRWLAGLVFFALVMTPVLEIHAAQPAHSVSGPATAVSFLQTSVRTWATPGASFAIPSVGALIGATFVLIIACVSVIPVDDFGMPTGCAIGSTVLFCATTITVFMFYEGNIWFFKEIVEMNIMMEIQPDDPTLDMMQSRLNSTSMIAFVVSLLYALVNYLCFVPMGEATCMVKKKAVVLLPPNFHSVSHGNDELQADLEAERLSSQTGQKRSGETKDEHIAAQRRDP